MCYLCLRTTVTYVSSMNTLAGTASGGKKIQRSSPCSPWLKPRAKAAMGIGLNQRTLCITFCTTLHTPPLRAQRGESAHFLDVQRRRVGRFCAKPCHLGTVGGLMTVASRTISRAGRKWFVVVIDLCVPTMICNFNEPLAEEGMANMSARLNRRCLRYRTDLL